EANRDGEGRFLDPYRLARALCLAAAAAARGQAIDTVTVDFRNAAALPRESEETPRDGFTGKMAIHPAQGSVINEEFTPPPAGGGRCAGGRRCRRVRGSPRQRHGRHRRGDVRPSTPRTRPAIAHPGGRRGRGLSLDAADPHRGLARRLRASYFVFPYTLRGS